MKTYFKLLFIYKNKELYTLWYSNDIDGLLNENNKIKYFNTENNLTNYAINKGIKIQPDKITVYNIDDIQKIIQSKGKVIDCEKVLNLWNIIADIAKTIGTSFYGDKDEITHIYDKLFYGNNLPAICEGNEMQPPIWDEKEISIIFKVLEDSYKIFELSCKS